VTAAGRIGPLPLALILLSLLLQALAPAQAAAMAAARLEPWANLPICGASAQRDHGAPTSQQEGCCHAACLVCAAASSLATLSEAPTPAASIAFIKIDLTHARSAKAIGASAPRPKARGPPLFS
jgi:hypothetical protein